MRCLLALECCFMNQGREDDFDDVVQQIPMEKTGSSIVMEEPPTVC